MAALQDLTEQKRAAEQLRQSNDRLRALAAELETVREEEKARVSLQVHDDLGQILTGLKIEIQRVAQWLGKPLGAVDPARFRAKIPELGDLADHALESIRRIARELRPSMIDDLGLIAAIDWQAARFRERSGLGCDLRITLKKADFPKEASIGIFRILQEALTNILRHAKARTVTIRLFKRTGRLVLEVIDDGIGIGAIYPNASKSLGILGMKERALQIGGTLMVDGKPGEGTTVHLEIPMARLKP